MFYGLELKTRSFTLLVFRENLSMHHSVHIKDYSFDLPLKSKSSINLRKKNTK